MELLKKDKKKIVAWTREQEELLAEWSEKATCYRWLHSRSEKRYRGFNYTFTIPVIILSTLTGTANFAMDSFVPDEYKQIAMACVGGTNIFAGILSTLQNFLRYAELMESHRVCEVQWSKFSRNIAVELALEPTRRKPADDFLKICRAEYDRLIEQSPTIDDPIINQFKKAFKNTDIQKPDMCNGLDKCKIYQPSKEEKLENVLTNVSTKLLSKKPAKKWDNVKIATEELAVVNDIKTYKKTAKNELDELKKTGRVSSFKKNILEDSKLTPIENILNVTTESAAIDNLSSEIDTVIPVIPVVPVNTDISDISEPVNTEPVNTDPVNTEPVNTDITDTNDDTNDTNDDNNNSDRDIENP
jgi:hypothetical protein